MFLVPERRNGDWPHVPRALAQPPESMAAIPRSSSKAKSEMPSLPEGSMVVSWACCHPRG
jgi:hypothetical protein